MTALTRRAAIAGGLCTFTLAAARANQDWPDRPITMVHGFPAGGPVDLVARIVADGLSRRLGQRVIVEGKPGASGTTAAAQVARAAPNGYTLFAIPSGHAVLAATFKTLPYRTVDDFTLIRHDHRVSLRHGDVRRQFDPDGGRPDRRARSKSTPLLYGTPGNGSGPHLAIELLGKAASIRLQHVPYRGSAPAVDRPDRQAPRFHDGSAGALLEFVRTASCAPSR